MTRRKILLTLLAIAMIAGVLVGCGSNDKQPTTTDPGETVGETPAVEEPKTIYLASDGNIPTSNIHTSKQASETQITNYIVSKLYQLVPDEDGINAYRAPELAADYPQNPSGDQKTWEIPLNPDAKWENGDSINADDYMYSWKMLLDPVLLYPNGSGFAEGTIEIVNAMEYYTQASTGEEVAWEDVGIKKLDDYTLEITTERKHIEDELVRKFSTASSGLVYEPLYEDLMNEDRTVTTYGTDADKIISCGPYVMTSWIQGAEHSFERNPNYLHQDRRDVDRFVYRVVEDTGTRMQMFENGELDFISLDVENRKRYEDDPRVLVRPTRTIRSLEINRANPKQPILGNVNFRRALFWAVDRVSGAEITSQTPANYYVSTTSVAYADGTPFRDVPGANDYLPENYGYDPEKAVDYFEKALEEEGLDKVEITLHYSDSNETAKILSEFLQQEWEEIFGDRFKLNLQAAPHAQNLDMMKGHVDKPDSFDISWATWTWSAGDFEPNRTFEVLQSTFARRNAPYNNEEFDELFKYSITDEVRLDEKKRAEVTMELEKITLDDVLVIPFTEGVTFNMAAERVELPMKVPHVSMGWGIRWANIK